VTHWLSSYSLPKIGTTLLSALVVLACAERAPAQETKRVLLLHSESRLLPVNLAIDQSIRATMSAKLGTQLDFYNEFLDQTRFADRDYELRFKNFLRDKYSGQKLDLIIAFAPGAVAFLENIAMSYFAISGWFNSCASGATFCFTLRTKGDLE